MKDATGSFSGGLYGLALLGLISAFVCAFFLHIPTARVLPAAPARVAELPGGVIHPTGRHLKRWPKEVEPKVSERKPRDDCRCSGHMRVYSRLT